MADIIVMAVVLICLGAAVIYIVKEKKKGVKCIGCPVAGNCPSQNARKASGCSGGFSGISF